MGKPGGPKARQPLAEYIGLGWRTRGTETSKYPQEEKTIVISQVVASEREEAQTKIVTAILGL